MEDSSNGENYSEIAKYPCTLQTENFWLVMRKWTLNPAYLYKSIKKYQVLTKSCYNSLGKIVFETDFPAYKDNTQLSTEQNAHEHNGKQQKAKTPGDYLIEDEWELYEDAWESSETVKMVYKRHLIPRLPDKDRSMDEIIEHWRNERRVVFQPVFPENESPSAQHLAFCYPRVYRFQIEYQQINPDSESADGKEGILILKAVLIDDSYLDNMKWFGKTLLEKLASWAQNAIKKKSKHEVMIPRSLYIDNYTRMKKTYSHLALTWTEKTDPLKFVYEDIAIAAFLISMWEFERTMTNTEKKPTFVDLGCGNGLLVYLLTKEGYKGYGIDLVKRKIWDQYDCPVDLRVEEFYPDKASFPDIDWLIGNHSDELTPWIPLIASRTPNTKYFILPCCFYDFGAKYAMNDCRIGKYQTYLNYLIHIGTECGFHVENETISIPSTKNQAQVGRRRILHLERPEDAELIQQNYQKLLKNFNKFVVRPPQPGYTPQKRFKPGTRPLDNQNQQKRKKEEAEVVLTAEKEQ